MPSYVDSYFGLQGAAGITVSDATLTVTDGELTVDLVDVTGGWFLLGPKNWSMRQAEFKGDGVYLKNDQVDGEQLKFTAFANVIEELQVGLNFYSPDDYLQRIETLSELLKVRGPKYWKERNYNRMVYLIRQIPGESKLSYAWLSRGSFILPDDMWDIVCSIQNGLLEPIKLVLVRQPFWHGAPPGQVQDTVELAAQQVWNFDLDWEQETSLPAGQIFCFGETEDGTIYAGGESEILVYTGSWAAATTTPVTLAGDVTSAVVLANGDILFGENGRIIKLSSGTWSVETTEPTGQVYALLEVESGEVYAGDNGRVLKRDTAGVWAEDDDLPDGDVYALFQSSSGRLFAGETGRILRSASPTPEELEVRIAASADSAEQYGSTVTVGGIEGDLDFHNRNYVGMRWPLAIPPGATINSAKLIMIAHRTHSGTTENVKIYCQAADDAGAFTAAANGISGRTLTTRFKNWSTSTKWTRNQSYESPDFASAVQEVIDRAGWLEDNYLAVIVKADTQQANSLLPTRREAYSYDLSPGRAVVLRVEYTIPPAAGGTWEVATTLPVGNVRSFLEVDSRIIAGEDGRMLASQDDGDSWAELTTVPNAEVLALAEDDDGILYAGEAGVGGRILRSADRGSNWGVGNDTLPVGNIAALLAGSDGDLRAGDDGFILKLGLAEQLELGQEATDENIVFVGNKGVEANLTHIFIYDDSAGTYTNIFPATSTPFALLPASPAVNDAIYFVIDSSLADTGPFDNLVFNLSTAAQATTSYTIVWEVYTGSWTSLTVKDGTNGFANIGVNSVHWARPSTWQTVAVGGVTGWAIRARLSALTGTLTPPAQDSRNIYSVVTNFVEVDQNEIGGTVDSLAKLQLNNRSAGGGPGGSNPPLYATRVVAGVKAVEGHENFRAFLNFSDEQNPDGVSLDTTVDPNGATSLQTDSGFSAAAHKRVFFDAGLATLDTMSDRCRLLLDTTIARDFYGSYKVFLRGKQTGGSAGQVKIRLKVVSGTGGISSLTDIQATQTTDDHHVLEFEQPITLPVSSEFTEDDIGDQTALVVQIETASASADFYLYDVFLRPNPIYVDALDLANSANSAVDDLARLLIDSITVPKAGIRTLAQKTATDLFKSSWLVDSNGPFTWLKVQRHRVWFMAMRTTAAGATIWISEPETVHSLRGWKTDRWLLGRGLA